MEVKMTLDEKIELFSKAVIDSATKQNIEIVHQYKESLQKQYDEHKENALRKAEAAYLAESENLVREKNRTLSSDSINIKRKISEKSSELIDKLFQDLALKLKEYMKTPEYFDLLTNQISKAKIFAREDEIIIYINPSDEGLKQLLEENTGVKLTVSTRDFVGGNRAVIHSKNILIDNSILTKLSEAKNSFSF
jgi:vacuolar-type H+-ATPase subunit E/Vma4